jgi:hypothetical protein
MPTKVVESVLQVLPKSGTATPVKVSRIEPWSNEQLSIARERRYWEWKVNMPTREAEALASAGRSSIEIDFLFNLEELLNAEWLEVSNIGKLSLAQNEDFLVAVDGSIEGQWRAMQAVARRIKGFYEDNGIVAKVTTFPNPSVESKGAKETAASKRETEKVYVYTLPQA